MSMSIPPRLRYGFGTNGTIYSGIVRMLRNALHKAKYIPKIETPAEPTQTEGGTENRGTHTAHRFRTPSSASVVKGRGQPTRTQRTGRAIRPDTETGGRHRTGA